MRPRGKWRLHPGRGQHKDKTQTNSAAYWNNAENRDAYLQKDKPDLSEVVAMEQYNKRRMLGKTA